MHFDNELLVGDPYSGGSRISPRRGRQLPGGTPTYDFAKFSQKLHEIERIWTPGGGDFPRAPLRSTTAIHCLIDWICIHFHRFLGWTRTFTFYELFNFSGAMQWRNPCDSQS